MATFHAYAEVVTDDSPQARLSDAGRLPFRPGRPLREYVEDGRYEFQMPLANDVRAQLREAARLTGESGLSRLADSTQVTISLEHLRGLDLDTRILCGVSINYTEEEARALQLSDPDPHGPTGQLHA